MDTDKFEEDMKTIFGSHLDETFTSGPNGTGIRVSNGTGMIHYWADLYEMGYFIQCISHRSDHTQVWIWTIEGAGEVSNFPEEIFAYHQKPDKPSVDDAITENAMATKPQKQPDESISGPDTTHYECRDCGNSFTVENVVEYEGCPDCKSRDTVQL